MLPTKSAPVLIVEDDPVLRSLYRAALQLEGFHVIAVEDGVDALRHLDVTMPAVVVLDLNLPRLNGRDVHREMAGRADMCHIPIVIVTGEDTSDLRPEDFACILHKPMDPAEVVSAIRRCLGRLPA